MGKNVTNSPSIIKDLIIDIGKRLWTRGYVAANDGNISVRTGKNELMITTSGVSKGFMSRDMIIKMSMDGEILGTNNQYLPSSEFKMHIQVYKERNDVSAVVHAHPPYSTSFAVAGVPIETFILPEAIIGLGEVPIAPYGMPSTMEIPDSIIPFIRKGDAILLSSHGALTLGRDLISAYYRMETLEHTAHILYLAIGLGNVNKISGEQVDKLMKIRGKMGIPGKIDISSVSSSGLKRSLAARAKKIRSRNSLLR